MNNLIDKFEIIYKTIKEEKKEFYLFMVLKMDEFIDRWSVVVSAPWIEKQEHKQGFNYVIEIIKKNIPLKDRASIARVGIFQPEEHLVDLITKTIHTSGESPMQLKDTRVNGFRIHEAYIFESKRKLVHEDIELSVR